MKSIVLWLIINVAVLASVNFYIWRLIGKWLPKNAARDRTAISAAKLSALLTFDAWLLGSFFFRMGRMLLNDRGIDSGRAFMNWDRSESAIYVSLNLISFASPLLVLCAIPFGILAFVVGKRKGDSVAMGVSLATIVLNVALVIFACASLMGLPGSDEPPQDGQSTDSVTAVQHD